MTNYSNNLGIFTKWKLHSVYAFHKQANEIVLY